MYMYIYIYIDRDRDRYRYRSPHLAGLGVAAVRHPRERREQPARAHVPHLELVVRPPGPREDVVVVHVDRVAAHVRTVDGELRCAGANVPQLHSVIPAAREEQVLWKREV